MKTCHDVSDPNSFLRFYAFNCTKMRSSAPKSEVSYLKSLYLASYQSITTIPVADHFGGPQTISPNPVTLLFENVCLKGTPHGSISNLYDASLNSIIVIHIQ